ncbi:FtsK/SpoIIIE domain-containing protein [Pantoea agglomerans]|uniref:FtsK/SpoIIIE domain-containing protein n=1 Tax=Enterobacter agglomerans TaxID=549 RepID=UPI003C7D7037
MNNPTYVCNTHPADDQSSAGHFLMAGETGAGKTVLAMSLIKDLLNQHTDGERHD